MQRIFPGYKSGLLIRKIPTQFKQTFGVERRHERMGSYIKENWIDERKKEQKEVQESQQKKKPPLKAAPCNA